MRGKDETRTQIAEAPLELRRRIAEINGSGGKALKTGDPVSGGSLLRGRSGQGNGGSWAGTAAKRGRVHAGEEVLMRPLAPESAGRRHAEEALRQSKENYGDIFLNAAEGIFRIAPDGGLLSVDPALATIYGYESPEAMIAAMADIKVFHADPEGRPLAPALIGRDGFLGDHECKTYRKDGSTMWISIRSRVVHSETGKVLYHEGTVRDITERKHMMEQITLQRDIVLQLARTGTLPEALNLVLRTAIKASGMECGGFWLRNDETGDELMSSIGMSDDFRQRLGLITVRPWALSAESVIAFLPVTREETPESFREGFKRLAILPIQADSDHVGTVTLFSRFSREVSEEGRITLDFLAAELGAVMLRITHEQQLRDEVKKHRETEEALKGERQSLCEANMALKVMLKHREEDRHEIEEMLVSNLKQLVLPYLEKLKKGKLEALQRSTIELVEQHVKEAMSPFLRNVRNFNLTPRQLEIVAFIKDGRTTKEIADRLYLGTGGIDTQRYLIRKKLGLNKGRVNLRSYLLSLT